MANSDIIKIGFDYRASLAQFEKDTNGVFDGISNKAGKQKIAIQLDAKDEKVIDKIKELQKLKLDKFTFEFGESGLKEQLQTFDKLENKINEIINLGKGKSFIDSSSTVAGIDKIENKINELNKKYEETQKKLSSIGSGNISGKDVNLVDNAEFKKLSDSFEKIKGEVDDLKTHMSLLDDSVVSGEQFIKLGEQVDGLSVKFDGLIDKYVKLSNTQKTLFSTPQESNISSGSNPSIEASQNNNISSIKKKKEALASYELQLEETRYEVEKLSKSENEAYGFNRGYNDKKVASLRDSMTKRLFGKYDPSSGKDGSKKWLALGDIANIDTSTLKSYQMWQEELQKVGYTLSEIKQTSIGLEADIIPIDGKAITNAEEFRKALDSITTLPSENVQLLNKQIAELESKISSLKSEITSLESSSTEPKKDAFPKTSENLEQVAQSEQKVQQEAVATDKALDNISFTPNTEGFDDIIAKFGILREQAEQITKIVKTTKQTADGTPDISYKATLKNGSSYYLGENSTPQVLNASETVYDSNAIEKAYQEAKKVNNALNETTSLLNSLKVPSGFEGSFSTLESEVKRLNSEFGSGKISATEYANSIKKAFSDYQTPIDSRSKDIWNELTTSLDRYATLQKRIASNNALSTDNEETAKLLEHIHELQRNDILPTEKLTASNEKLQQINQTVTDLKAKLKESTLDSLQSSIDKYQKIYDQRKTYSSDFTPSEQYTRNLSELDTAIKNLVEYKNTLKNVGEVTVEQETKLKGLVTACEKASDSFKSLSASEKGASQIAVDKLVQRINKDLDECTNYSKEAKLGLRALRDELESANPRNLKEITSEIINIENAEIRAGRAGRSFFDTLKNSGFHQIAAQMAGMFGVYDVINLGKEAISTIVGLDDALVDLKKTTAMNSTQLEQYYYDANDVAKQMGVTTEEIINQSSAWSRLGYNTAEASTEMAKLSSQFASISPGMDVDEAQSGLVSIMKANFMPLCTEMCIEEYI